MSRAGEHIVSNILPTAEMEKILDDSEMMAAALFSNDRGEYDINRLLGLDPRAIGRISKEIASEAQASGDPEDFVSVHMSALMHLLRHQAQLGHKDGLTGAFNKTAFHEAVEQHIDALRRYFEAGMPRQREGSAPAAGILVMIDLDKFKPINDTYGHNAGDEVLKLVADTIRDYVRADDIVGRLGGDEFAVLVRNATPKKCQEIFDRLDKAFKNLKLIWNHDGKDVEIPVGASLGFTKVNFLETAERNIGQADAEMYAVKKEKPGSRALALDAA